MDPDANLARQLELARMIDEGGYDAELKVEMSEELAELVLALHEWLARGGFKPKAWEVKP